MTDCPAVLDLYVEPATCELPAGHDGPHYTEAWGPDGILWLGRMTANEAQHAAGRAWAAKYRRYPARTEEGRLRDFNATEALLEIEKDRRR